MGSEQLQRQAASLAARIAGQLDRGSRTALAAARRDLRELQACATALYQRAPAGVPARVQPEILLQLCSHAAGCPADGRAPLSARGGD